MARGHTIKWFKLHRRLFTEQLAKDVFGSNAQTLMGLQKKRSNKALVLPLILHITRSNYITALHSIMPAMRQEQRRCSEYTY